MDLPNPIRDEHIDVDYIRMEKIPACLVPSEENPIDYVPLEKMQKYASLAYTKKVEKKKVCTSKL